MKRKERKQIIVYGLVLWVLLLCVGCTTLTPKSGTSQTRPNHKNLSEQVTSDGTESTEDRDLYMITSFDPAEEIVQLYRYANGRDYRFYFSMDTRFRDKYGNHSTASDFYPGKAVYIGSVSEDGKLSQIMAADEVWQYDDVVRFSVDEERGIFRIADTNYRITGETWVFSDTQKALFSDITKNDKLSVTGQGKNILSVCITTGHGKLQLLNTELFEGSLLQLNSDIFAEVTPEMEMELPEGEYLLAVANNGWGGSCQIEVARGETTSVDLDSIKGEGPKYGIVHFSFDVEGAVLTIDGKVVDYSEPVTLQYGKHRLLVDCTGYEEVSKYLYVNSEEASIMISFTEEVEEPETETEEETEEKTAGTESDSESSQSSKAKDEALKDYLSTLTELIDSL